MSLQDLSLLAGVGAPVPVPPEVVDALQHVEIVTAIGERGSFRLSFRLDPGSRLPARFLLESGDLVRLVVSTRAGEVATVVMDGVMVEHMVSTGDKDTGPGLVITGEDLTLLMDLVDAHERPFPAMPVEARVQVLLAGYGALGVTPHVVAPPLNDLPTPSERVPHQRGTDYAYIRSLADAVGYRFTLDPGPLPGASVAYWGPEPRGDRTQPALTVDFGRPAEIETLQLRFDVMQRVAPKALTLDPVSKAVIPIPVPNIDALGSPLGAVVPPAHRHQRLRWTAKLTPTQAAGALLAADAGSAEAMTGLGAMNLVGGRPRLRVGAIVEVRGASAPFNGLFAVARVRDTITPREHRQEFEFMRAGLGAA